MFLSDTISKEYIQKLVEEKTRISKSFICFKGSDIDSSDSNMVKLAKNICAIANSDGGTLIYGIKSLRNRATSFDYVKNFTKDNNWLINEVQAQINSPINNLKIEIINFDDNLYTIIINIPSNNDQPHMFSDNKYYGWKKNKAVVLEEDEVRLLYGKLSKCELEYLGIYNTNGIPSLLQGKYSSMSFYPKILIRNSGNIVEKDYKIEISFPADLYEESFQPLKSMFIRHDGNYAVFGQKGINPLFQQEISTMIEAKISINRNNITSFLNESLNITLYYSNGIKKHSLKLSETLTYNGKVISKNDFTDINSLRD
jgi:hypothetical protein